MGSIPHAHGTEPRRSRAAQNAQQHSLGKVVCMMREYNGIADLFLPHPMEEVISAEPRRCFKREPVLTRIRRNIPLRTYARDLPCPAKFLHKTCIRTRICPTYAMLIMGTYDLCTAAALQHKQHIQKGKRIHPAGTSDEQRARGRKKIMRAKNALHLLLQCMSPLQKGHSAWSALCYPHPDRYALSLWHQHFPVISRGAIRAPPAWNPSCGADRSIAHRCPSGSATACPQRKESRSAVMLRCAADHVEDAAGVSEPQTAAQGRPAYPEVP